LKAEVSHGISYDRKKNLLESEYNVQKSKLLGANYKIYTPKND
jgi:hypothetical protein